MNDELQWNEVQHDEGDTLGPHWRAQADPLLGGEYNVAVMSYMRGAGESVMAGYYPGGKPPVELYNGLGGPAISAAKAAAQQHHNTAARAARWAEYMRNNEPPAVVPPVDHHPQCGDLSVPDCLIICDQCGGHTKWCGCRYHCPRCQPAAFNRTA